MKDISQKSQFELEFFFDNNERKIENLEYNLELILKKIEEGDRKIKIECLKKLDSYFEKKNIVNETEQIKTSNARYWTDLLCISYLNLQKSKIQGLDGWELLNQNHENLQITAREKINSDFVNDPDFIEDLNAFFEQIPELVNDNLYLESEKRNLCQEINSLKIEQDLLKTSILEIKKAEEFTTIKQEEF